MRKLYGWEYLREAREEQAADRPLDQRHGDRAQLPANARSRPAPTARPCSAPRAAIRSAINYPTDGSVLIIAPSAIMKGTKHLNAAKLFMEYLYSVEASKINVKHFAMPMRPEVRRPRAPSRSSKVKRSGRPIAEIDKGIPEVIEQWRDTFGN